MNKKADVSLGLQGVMGLILGGLAIIILVAVGLIMYNAFFAEHNQASETIYLRFKLAAAALDKLKEESCYLDSVSVDDGYVVAGFSGGTGNKAVGSCPRWWKDKHFSINKPEACGVEPCLCLCKIDGESCGSPECDRLDSATVFDPINPGDEGVFITYCTFKGESDDTQGYNIILEKKGNVYSVKYAQSLNIQSCASLISRAKETPATN